MRDATLSNALKLTLLSGLIFANACGDSTTQTPGGEADAAADVPVLVFDSVDSSTGKDADTAIPPDVEAADETQSDAVDAASDVTSDAVDDVADDVEDTEDAKYDIPLNPDVAVDAVEDSEGSDATLDVENPPADVVDAVEQTDVVLLDGNDLPDVAADVGTDVAVEDVQDAVDTLSGDTGDANVSNWQPICFACHGDASRDDPAPPVDLTGHTETTYPGVGAHQSHLKNSDWRHAITCQECHPVPNPYAATHFNQKIDFLWGPIAKQGTFDTQALQCSGSYCHGATLATGDLSGTASNKTPTWNVVDGSQEACGTACHTVPPGGKHPASTDCANCHGEVIASFDPTTKKATWANASLHVNGTLEVGTLNCTSCHGDAATANPAPPKGTKGETLTSQAAVGAHTAHLIGGAWHRQVVCNDCHTLPASTAHANGAFDFAFSAVASAAGTVPAFDAATLTCSNTYCHGVTTGNPKTGGEVKHTPIWNQVDGSFDSCGASCHTNPPAEPHAQSTNCVQCHGEVIASYDAQNATATWTKASLHVNGKVEVITLTCTSCHGDPIANSSAPPNGTQGETLTTQAAVGAHQSHLKPSPWHRQGSCSDCHTVPQSTSHTNGIIDFAWSVVAAADGAQPKFDPQTVTCASAYCHGATLNAGPKTGGTLKLTPVWTQSDGSFEACGASCHTNPPGGKHPPNNNCAECHTEVIASYDPATMVAVWTKPELHVNGNIEVVGMSCTTCHGDAATNNPAPPKGPQGETLTTQPAVGAHAQHLGTSAWHREGQCTDCHTVPASIGHANGQSDLKWGTTASADGATPTYDATNVTCSNVYCHGTTLTGPSAGGNTKTTPKWTQVDGTFDSCGASCHTNPPGGTHPKNTDCALCHGSVIASFDTGTQTATWANASLHVDGTVETSSLSCTTCHGDAATNNPAPPKGTLGETLTTQAAVGAHAQHLGASSWHRDGLCVDCHTLPTSMTHANGVQDFTWGALALTGNSTPAFDAATVTCNAVYCHGNTLPPAIAGSSTKKSPVWNKVDGTFDACGSSCHTNPPGGSHTQSTACEICHTEVISNYNPATKQATWASPSLHIDGQVEVKSLNCTSCHGSAATNDPAPPTGTHGEQLKTSPAVGAHQSHLGASDWHRAGQCTDCHTVPASVTHSNGLTDLNFAGPSTVGGAKPAFDTLTVSCSSVYCHGTTLFGPNPGGSLKQQPIWTQNDGTFNACGSSCHTTPPGAPHAQNSACETCHGEVIQSFKPGVNGAAPTVVWKDASRHVNGIIDAPALTCTACHGDAATNNPAPPTGTKGETLTTQAAVGAHQQHLNGSNWHRDVLCADCHKVPAQTLHSNGVDDVDFGALASTGGTLPQFSTSTVTCDAVYCHGATLPVANAGGTTKKSPIWTKVDGSFDACGSSCHTNPPGGTHPQNTACQTCHTSVIQSYDVAAKTAVWVDKSKHINGTVEVTTLTCTSCHGNQATGDPSPPKGTKGETLTSQAAVGAHQAH